MLVDSQVNNNQSFCTVDLLDCNDLNNFKSMFKPLNEEYILATKQNMLESGEIVSYKDTDNGIMKMSNNRKVVLKLEENGNLVLFQHQTKIWENGMGFFKDYPKRIRINEKGHLIQEIKGLFSQTVPNYRSNEWITVWSSAPINHNVTIGIPKLIGSLAGYKLIVENTGDLNLYDSIGTLIWSATKQNAKHRFGYKFPEVYLVPTNFLTPAVNGDKHNSLDMKSLIINENLFNSKLDIIQLEQKNFQKINSH
jgi:hypothetical protein